MCGLVMVVNKYRNGFNQQQQDVFNTLLYLSGGFRGRDGAGVVLVDNIGNVKLAKSAQPVDEFLHTKEYAELDKAAFHTGWALIGHNRAATRGNISDENAHPFIIDDKIVMVHNGTFYGDHKHIKDTAVDSEAIGHLLLEHEPEEALKKVNAAYALIWYNVENKQIHVIRNNARPLWYMETGSSIIYASEEPFLKFVIDKYSLKPEHGPYQIAPYNHGVFTLKNNKDTEYEGKDLKCEYKAPESHNRTAWGYPFLEEHPGCYNPNHSRYGNWVAPPDVFERVVGFLGKKAQATTHGEWVTLSGKYPEGSRVYIDVEEIIEADENPKTKDFILIGKTVDGNDISAAFKVYNKELEEACKMVGKRYGVTPSKLIWRRVEEVFPNETNKPMNEWIGVPFIQGYDPQELLMIENVH